MPQWMHDRAEHILAKNPSMPKSEAFAIATQQMHALGKGPKGYGTSEGRAHARAKYDTPEDDKKTASLGSLSHPRLVKQAEQEHRRVHGAYVDKSIPVIRPQDNHIQAIEDAIEGAKGDPVWSHHQVAIPKTHLDLKEHGFKPTCLAIPLPGETWGTVSYRRGSLHAHDAGPMYLIHKDADEPGLMHMLRDVPGALKKRFLSKVEPFVKEKSAKAKKHKENSHTGLALTGGGFAATLGGGALAQRAVDNQTAQSELHQRLVADTPAPIRYVGESPSFDMINGDIYMPPKSRNTAALAHEMGHADIHKNRFGRMVQNPTTWHMGQAAPMVGVASGLLTGNSDNERVRQLGLAAPVVAAAPELAYEAGASIQALRRMRRAGATRGQMLRGAATTLAPGFASYAGRAGIGLGAALSEQQMMQQHKEKKAMNTVMAAACADELANIQKQAGLWQALNTPIAGTPSLGGVAENIGKAVRGVAGAGGGAHPDFASFQKAYRSQPPAAASSIKQRVVGSPPPMRGAMARA